MKNHKITHNKTTRTPYKCDECETAFVKYKDLKLHKMQHKFTGEHTCKICNIGFDKKQTLDFHKKSVHKGIYVRICEICQKEFRSKYNYEEHYKIAHSNKKLPTIRCEICGSMLKHEVSLRKHMQKHNQKPEECNICGKMTPNKDALLKHKKYHHWNEKK